MEQDDKYFDLIEGYLNDSGINNPDIRMELSDHLYSILEEDKIESELIPSDILSLTEDGLYKYDFKKTYQELIDIRKGRLTFRNYIRELFSFKHLRLIIGIIVVQKIIFFVVLPGFIPFDWIHNTMLNLAIATIVMYFGLSIYWLLRPYYILKKK